MSTADRPTVTALYQAVRDLTGEQPATPEGEIAAALIDQVDDETRRDIALTAIEGWVWQFRRADQLAIERAAQQGRDRQEAEERLAALARDNETTEQQFQRIFDDPRVLYSRAVPQRDKVWLGKSRDRKKFARWCGDRFGDWYRRADTVVNGPESNVSADLFLGDWHPEELRSRDFERVFAQTTALIEQIADEIRMEFTTELLASEFALGDGRRVTWGQATIADHEQRIDLLTKNAAANAEAAARHATAVRALKATGAERLADVPELATAS